MYTLIKQEPILDKTGMRNIGYQMEEAREIEGKGCFVRSTKIINYKDDGRPFNTDGSPFCHISEQWVEDIKIGVVGETNEGPILDLVDISYKEYSPEKKEEKKEEKPKEQPQDKKESRK